MPDEDEYRYSEEYYREFKTKVREILIGEITVDDSQTEICVESSPLSERIKLRFYVDDDNPIYLINDGDEVSEGYVVLPGRENEQEFVFDPSTIVDIYAITDSDETATVKVMEVA